jgi:outer membrane receptor protein involved in Fe transport
MLGGLRFDYFRFAVDDELTEAFTGTEGAWRLQPKLNVAFTPSNRMPLTFYLNYGRGISSQDARGVVQMPEGEKIATTDFYQLGMSYSEKRFSLSSDLFFIDRSNEQVYIPDDGSIEFLGPSRSYGFEVKTSVSLTRVLALSGGLTRVGNAYFRGTLPRIYLDRAPHLVSNAALTLMDWHGFTGSLRYRHISSYRLDGEDPALRASGFDLLDFSMAKRISRWLDFNLSIDNLTDKRYFETQNYFESRPIPGGPIAARIHATPGYPIGVTAGLTFHLLGK